MSARALLGCILFLGLVSLFANGLLATSSQTQGFYNSTSGNNTATFINGTSSFNPAFNQVAICAVPPGDNPYTQPFVQLINAIPLLNCVTGFTYFLFSFQGFSSTIGWLQIILWADIIVLAYLGMGLLRGGK